MTSSSAASYGQVIEYIQDRLYLASYTHAPNDQTPFPYPTKQSKSPSKRASKCQTPSSASRGPKVHPPVYFSMDDSLLYNAFHHDFGPLHIGHLYRFAVYLHDLLGNPANEGRGVVFWSKADSRSRANAACLLACYMVLIQSWPPHLALSPIAQADPPFMPFRDAGYSQADYVINIQDVVYGVWRAKEEQLCELQHFSIEEYVIGAIFIELMRNNSDQAHRYEKYERVDMGDFNWLTPSFLAFASPQNSPVQPMSPSSPQYNDLPKTISALTAAKIPTPFKNVLAHFASRNIGLVVRLNSELYCPSYFTALGIDHLDMIFDDGTCPPLALVKKFIKLAHEMITVKHKAIAVHCKAGLGRTGCLIGAYLIYKHGFTANEIIAFMRFMRPGMVVGPQQHWLHLNQGAFREWWWEDTMREKYAKPLPSTPTKTSHKQRLVSNTQMATPPNAGTSKRAPLGEVENNESPAMAGQREENLPAPTPGQPRKTSRLNDRHHPYPRSVSLNCAKVEEAEAQPTTEMVSMHRQTQRDGESEEEWQLRMMARRTSSKSPRGRDKRAVSYTTTTTTTTSYSLGDGSESDIENRVDTPPQRPKTPASTKSGSGAGNLAVAKVRASPKRNSDRASGAVKEASGVRKTSARMGSVNGTGTVPRKT
ncbi:MAG: cell division control protein 14 [Sclerophora amabilis]|nr:MAG: cell division control protein 14 [Sclerophora amabilis]